jgi:hypothetical protein
LFLSPPLKRLTLDGRLEPLESLGGAAWRRPVIVLARELCLFSLFDPRAARGAAAMAAARLHAAAAAPFDVAGWLVRRSGGRIVIWWWDQARVSALLGPAFARAPPILAPESLAQAAGDDWRIVRTATGFEAQLWNAGDLVGSSWQRRPFDAAAWSTFVRVQPPTQRAAPIEPPNPVSPAPARPSGLGSAGWRDVSATDWARAGVAGGAVLLVLLAAFWLGQGLRLRSQSQALEAQALAERGIAPVQEAGARDDTQQAQHRLSGYRALAGRPNPIAALGAATPILRLYGAPVQGVDAEGDYLTLTLPYNTLDRIDRVAADLRASGAFVEVRPTTDAARRVILLRLKATSAVNPGA